jgi:hypothetical protein
MMRLMAGVVLGGAAFASTACDAGPGDAAPGKARSAGDVQLQLEPYFRDLRLVRAAAGSDTLSLLLDTGGGTTLLTPAAARRLGCPVRGEDTGHRMTGEPVVFGRCASLEITAAGWTRTIAPVGVFDLAAVLPPELPRLDGVLALDAFRGRAVTLDWAAGLVTIHGDRSADSAVARWGVPLRIATGDNGRFLSTLARVDGTAGPLWFLVDSGNLRGTLVATSVQRDSLLPPADSGRVVIRIGARAPYPASVTWTALVLDGALGTDFLRRGPLTIDLRGVPATP